jgi:hypothetical protein
VRSHAQGLAGESPDGLRSYARQGHRDGSGRQKLRRAFRGGDLGARIRK